MHSHALVKNSLQICVLIGKTPLIQWPASLLPIFYPRVNYCQALSILQACSQYQKGLRSCHQPLRPILRSTQQRALVDIDDNAGRVGSDSDLQKYATKTRPDKAWHYAKLPFCLQILSHWQGPEPEKLWRLTDDSHHQRREEAVP